MNDTLFNFTLNTYDVEKVNTWDSIINNYCEDWKNYSTNAHNFYIILFWLYLGLRGLSKFYNPILKFKKRKWLKSNNKFINKIIKFLKLDFIEFEIKPIEDLADIVIMILLLRIFQVYYIMKYLLK